MEKIAIITDSAADLSDEYISSNNIYQVNLYVSINEKFYKDKIEISPDKLVELIEGESKLNVTTSAPSPRDFTEIYQKVKRDGYDKAIYIGLNPRLSATFLNASRADFSGLEVHMLDSGSVTILEGIIVMYVVDLIKENLCIDDIIKKVNKVVGSQKAYAYFDTLKYLKAGGRLGKVAQKASMLLNLKPILSLDGKGDFDLVNLKATRQKAYNIMEEKIREDLKKAKKFYLSYISGKDTSVIDQLRKRIKDIDEKAFKTSQSRFGSVISAHAGSKAFALGYLIVED